MIKKIHQFQKLICCMIDIYFPVYYTPPIITNSEKNDYLTDLSKEILSDITIFNKYARYLPEENRRETWEEICERNMKMHIKKFPKLKEEIEKLYSEYVVPKKVFASMRSMQFAGKPIELSPSRMFNCSYVAVNDIVVFSECMFNLLMGNGVGFSVQEHHIKKLSEIKKPTTSRRFVISDSIEGWAESVNVLIKSYFIGKGLPRFDFSDIRPKGARLVTSGGKAPGPDPLRICLEKIKMLLDSKENGSKLTSVECHDIICFIADAVLAGGIRRAALISLFDFDDENMLRIKSNFKINKWEHLYSNGPVLPGGEPQKVIQKHLVNGSKVYYDLEVEVEDPYYGKKSIIASWVSETDFNSLKEKGTLPWFYFHSHRGRANNTAVILRYKIKEPQFKKFWKIVQESGCGEPGFYFTNDKNSGLNPCTEISFQYDVGFCNLTSINLSLINSQEEFVNCCKAASFIGTLQASYTDFQYLRPEWKEVAEKEALLGVSMTGIANRKLLDSLDFKEGAEAVLKENERVAKIIGIRKAARTTAIKPEGTLSLVAGTSSGIHSWFAKHYLRRMRIGKNESLYTYLLINNPELLEDDIVNRESNQSIISIPQKAPEGSITREESTNDLLERVKYIYDNWVVPGHRKGPNTHNVSATISIRDNEWDIVGEWMWNNREHYNCLSVLPYDGGTYIQAPFEEITKEQFEEYYSHLHKINLRDVVEIDDSTQLKEQAACASGQCEL